MKSAFLSCATAAITCLGAGFVADPAAPYLHDLRWGPVALTSVEATGPTDVTLAIGGTAAPIPLADYRTAVTDRYVTPVFPNFTSANAQSLNTPELFYPLTGVKSLPVDTSIAQGLTILDGAIRDQVGAGNRVTVVGISQSAIIANDEMKLLAAQGNPVPGDALNFVLLGNDGNPNGGLFQRFEGLTLPSLGATFTGATPPDTSYPTAIYTLEYDGIADFPRYPMNLLADLNAAVGMLLVHTQYPTLDPSRLVPVADGGTMIELPTDPGYGTATTYWMIPMNPGETLPLLQALLPVPFVGRALADLLQPVLTPLVNLGYGDPDFGWSTGPANVPTGFGLFPDFDMVLRALAEMVAGIPVGVQAATGDLMSPGPAPHPEPAVPDLAGLSAGDPSSWLVGIVNAFTAAASAGYAFVLPTVDFAVALGVGLPTYDAGLLVDNLANPIDALGLPIAADLGLITVGSAVYLASAAQALGEIIADLAGIFAI